ncbi:hypothetical protein C8R47DRAFT_1083766 [Mycena vitilis]|nr:hypothetical protein C8R47DRAFT_1083766 [Mycena vitilis]
MARARLLVNWIAMSFFLERENVQRGCGQPCRVAIHRHRHPSPDQQRPARCLDGVHASPAAARPNHQIQRTTATLHHIRPPWVWCCPQTQPVKYRPITVLSGSTRQTGETLLNETPKILTRRRTLARRGVSALGLI